MITLIFQFAFPIAIVFYLLGLVFYLCRQPKTGFYTFLIGFISHTLFQISRGLSLGIWFVNLFLTQASSFCLWSMAAICLMMRFFSKNEEIRAIIDSTIIPVSLFSVTGLVFSPGESCLPDPASNDPCVGILLSIDIIAQACFILGCMVCFLPI